MAEFWENVSYKPTTTGEVVHCGGVEYQGIVCSVYCILRVYSF